ncbi:NAD(P)-dependent oxidoreductase [Phytoactinopolyspora alkaliphila]|uniref:NAD(P)-dependent oxidoreductase n=1 Tax=Phytoactinopolyspora alkaliphila TaxID=1783498 RepID=A0A6N9YK75_9ACTN|nr:NAD(P)-dependent oxidoreductase [Phytoactinopolyspora alkaliphila]NED95362.1 NAD(P)-dependent oxidoreductase [Phytoactinopolyspora alkaliphila]
MKRCLLTGAAGRIGRAVLRALADDGVPTTALILDDAPDLSADRTIVGDAADPRVVTEALRGFGPGDVVVHLAARPSPLGALGVDVFAGNARATYSVLETAAIHGVRRAVIASSMSIYGFAWSDEPPAPAYLPVDEEMPFRIADPYALSKQADENTARMMHRQYGLNVVALRFPLTTDSEALHARVQRFTRDPASGARELWSYLHVDDAARAVLLAARAELTGVHPLALAAQDTLAPYPTAELVRQHLPGVRLRKDLPARSSPIDTQRAHDLLGFAPSFTASVPPLTDRPQET